MIFIFLSIIFIIKTNKMSAFIELLFQRNTPFNTSSSLFIGGIGASSVYLITLFNSIFKTNVEVNYYSVTMCILFLFFCYKFISYVVTTLSMTLLNMIYKGFVWILKSFFKGLKYLIYKLVYTIFKKQKKKNVNTNEEKEPGEEDSEDGCEICCSNKTNDILDVFGLYKLNCCQKRIHTSCLKKSVQYIERCPYCIQAIDLKVRDLYIANIVEKGIQNPRIRKYLNVDL